MHMAHIFITLQSPTKLSKCRQLAQCVCETQYPAALRFARAMPEILLRPREEAYIKGWVAWDLALQPLAEGLRRNIQREELLEPICLAIFCDRFPKPLVSLKNQQAWFPSYTDQTPVPKKRQARGGARKAGALLDRGPPAAWTCFIGFWGPQICQMGVSANWPFGFPFNEPQGWRASNIGRPTQRSSDAARPAWRPWRA